MERSSGDSAQTPVVRPAERDARRFGDLRSGERRRARRAVLACLCLLPLLSAPALAAPEPVFVKAREHGRGLLRERNGECFVITPHHVVGDESRITIVARGRIERLARNETVYGGDVALLRLESERPLGCSPFWDTGEKLDEALRKNSEGVITSLNEDGSVERRAVHVTSYDERLIIVRPDSERDRFHKGLSGSLLEIRGAPAGMLMQVEPEAGEGMVLRTDHLSDIIHSFFAVETPAPAPGAANYRVAHAAFRAIASKRLEVREQPDRFARSVRSLRVGEVVKVTGQVDGRLWYRVELADGGTGFVPTDALRPL